MKKYDHQKIERKWQAEWEKSDIYQAKDNSAKPKSYILVEFPYPSGEGLHVGHIRSYTALDIVARKRRMEGKNVLYPMGWDAFGLPTENYAVKTGIHPAVVTRQNTDRYREQLKSLGFSFDWSREINTSDPKYYKWTQWLFLQFFKHGLAYKKRIPINWCTSCLIGLANEEVVNGRCERCGGGVEKREKEQWMLRITKYADRLLQDLAEVDYLPEIKKQQENWIGRSEGAEIEFKIKNKELGIRVFTTRPDTVFGVTYLILSPEYKEIPNYKSQITNWDEVKEYIKRSSRKTEIERTAEGKDKTGVELKGIRAVNPANNEEIPVWVADYVLADYGTGAIMAVPAHDERDREFAEKFSLPISDALLADSEEVLARVGGEKKVIYKLRDWVFSRQRYWGEPIPLVYCGSPAGGCGWQAVPEKDLPVELPEVENYKPCEDGQSPLASISEWVNTTCPKCGGPAKRETDTMPNWAGSAWYYLRYTDPQNDKKFASQEKLGYWIPVDWYNGGMEHVTLHLLYSRFWHKFLFDQKLVPTSEPYKKRTAHGLILAPDGGKMSKSRGNVINPDELVGTYGADTLRLYEMFIGPFGQAVSWQESGIIGPRRFLERVYHFGQEVTKEASSEDDPKIEPFLHKTIKRVTEDIEAMRFNTVVSGLMILFGEIVKSDVSQKQWGIFVCLLAPFAPHLAEELWQFLDSNGSVHEVAWPDYDEASLVRAEQTIVVQINGVMRDTVTIAAGVTEDGVKKMALQSPKVEKYLVGKEIRRVIHIPNRVINFVLDKF